MLFFSGHFYLTNLLLDNMKETAKSSGIEGRIVNLSSVAHICPYKGGIRFHKINHKSRYYSVLFCMGSTKMLLHLCWIFQKSPTFGGSDTHMVEFLNSPCNIYTIVSTFAPVQCWYYLLVYSNCDYSLLILTFTYVLFFWTSYQNKLAYGQSKLANILHANELSRHLQVIN